MMLTIPIWAAFAALALAACGIAAGILLYLSLQGASSKQSQSLATLALELANERERIHQRFLSFETRIRSNEDRAAVLVPPSPPRSGLNWNKRAQVIRLSRQGEKPAGIASALQLPKAEVELLLKMEKMAAEVPA